MLHAGKFKFVSISGGKENFVSIKMIQNLKQLEQLDRIQLMRKQLITGVINRSTKIIKSCIYSETVNNIFYHSNRQNVNLLTSDAPSPHSHTQTLFLCVPHPPIYKT